MQLYGYVPVTTGPVEQSSKGNSAAPISGATLPPRLCRDSVAIGRIDSVGSVTRLGL